ncbi:MAG TPA: cell wall hydrolase [Sphingomonas sp.]
MFGRIPSGLMALIFCASIGRPALADSRPSPPALAYAVPAIAPDATLSWTPLKIVATKGGDIDCLTAAIYYEARSESLEGQRAVAAVVLNRVNRPAFAPSVCGVVHQRARGACQFSFMCDGSTHARKDERAWETAARIAREALGGLFSSTVGSATFYHTVAVSPDWSARVSRVATIGRHVFYRSIG